jgi:uncharacterized protein
LIPFQIRMKRHVVTSIFIFFTGIALLVFFKTPFILFLSKNEGKILSPLGNNLKKSTPEKQLSLKKYRFEVLSETKFEGGEIKLEKIIAEEENYTSWLFSYSSQGKKVSGMANIPKGIGPSSPVIIMVRGWADKDIYFTGLGTRKAAGVFAENGFLTLAPDFLGFGQSDDESDDILEARFTRPVTILSLLSSLENFSLFDNKNIFLWGHSNGGQIALSVLETTGKNYPTVLWAPVTQSFPESVLQYINYDQITPESQLVIDRFDEFLKDYNPEDFDINTYLDRITAPIQIYQGGSDDWVPKEWQEEVVVKLENLGKKIDYFYYPNSDHNLKENWDEVVSKNIRFYKSFLD